LVDEGSERLELKSYGAILRRWLWLILLLTVVTTGVIYYRSSTAPPIYQAAIELQVIAQEPEEVALFTPLRGAGTEEQIRAVRDDFVTILESTSIARQTIGELNLNINARQLLKDINVRIEGEFITVMARAVGPQAAEELVTTHVRNALEYYRQVRSRPAEIAEEFIAAQLRESKEELAAAENAFLKFKLEHEVGSLYREIEALQGAIRNLSQRRDEARVEMERELALATEMKKAAEEAWKRAEEAEAREATATADHYRSMAHTFEAAAINHAASAEGYRTSQAQYAQIIAQRKADLAALIGLSAEYDALQNALEQAQARVTFLADKANEAGIKKSQALSAGYLQIIKPAQTPSSPVPSNIWQLVMLGGVVSLITGTILAFLLEILSARRHRAARRAALQAEGQPGPATK